ncbi:MAG TPA: hypothetical protein VNO18_08430 [Xanthobacteraceae bacterium]|jgi:hypothetical protein|nr:hypothetical protein [Xanthobacteraceae bacterium]
MPRFRIPELVLGALFATIFWAGILGWQASYAPTERQKEECYATAQKTGHKTEDCKTLWERTTTDPISLFTLVLAISTIGLWGATIALYFTGEKQIAIATVAANALDASAKAATAIEFPIIRASWLGPELLAVDGPISPDAPYGGAVNDGWPTRFSAISYFEFRNYGRTPAFPFKIAMGITVAKVPPSTPIYSRTIRCEPNTVIEGSSNRTVDIHFGFELTEDQIDKITDSSVALWFYILLTYHDVMDRPHEGGFCWHLGKQNVADATIYFFDDGSAPAAYTRKT